MGLLIPARRPRYFTKGQYPFIQPALSVLAIYSAIGAGRIMPLELQIIRASEFVRLGAHDHLDFETSKAALALLAGACRKRGLDLAMLDLRELPVGEKPFFTSAELAALVDTFRAAGFTKHQKLAILYKTDPHHGARLFSFVGRLKGWQVRAFSKFEDALTWLSAESSEFVVDNEPAKKAVSRDSRQIDVVFKKEHLKTSRTE